MATNTIRWVALAREIGPELSGRAARHDQEGEFSMENYALLKRKRFFSMAVPAELGGGGAGYRELCDTIFELAGHCGSTALAFSMHAHLVAATVWKHLHGQSGEALLRKVADEELVLLSTGASDWVDSNGTLDKVDGGYRLNARKVFCSGSPVADIAVASATYQDPSDGSQVLHFAVPMSSPGVTVTDDWNTLGMRATGSNSVLFENVFVPDDAIVLRRQSGQWHPAWSVVVTVAVPIFMSAYAGIAEAAAAIAMDAARGRADADHVPFAAGELQNRLLRTQLAWRAMVDNAADYDFAPHIERASRTLSAKTLCAEAAIATVQQAMMLAGGRSYFRGMALERLLRDVHGAPYHPLPAERQLQFSGLVALGRDPITGEPVQS